jgi:hydrogenase nickel incorporation protein HypA/HybF
MHELSLAKSIADIVISQASKRHAQGIKTVKLRLGEFTGVVREALEFGFEAIVRGTPAAAAKLEIEMVPLTARCTSCNLRDQPVEGFRFICAGCGSPVEIVTGREMVLEYVELVDEQA